MSQFAAVSGHDSDSLGIAGEDAFRSLCSRAKLIPTKTDVDRCGWDFRVEWRTTDHALITDNSPPRRAALVQVKSVFSGSDKFAVRLGAANDLVKAVEPSFFVVLVFSQELELLEVHGAPTVGPIASEILKAIRQFVAKGEDARPRSKQFGIKKWTDLISVQPKALADYFSDHIGPDLREYSAAKQKFLRETGYEEAHLSLNAKLYGTPEEVADAFLGDRPISGELVSAFEQRFKISLPLENFEPMSGSFEFDPKPHAQSRVTFQDTTSRRRFRFEGNEYRLPAIVADRFIKVKFDFQYFSLYLTRSSPGNVKVAFRTKAEELRSIRATSQSWLEFYRFIAAASTSRLVLKVRQIGAESDAWAGEVGPEPILGNKLQMERAIAVLELLDRITRESGAISLQFSPNDIADMEHTLDCLAQSFGRIERPFLNLSVDTLDPPLMKGRVILLLTFRLFSQFLTVIIRAECVEHIPRDSRDEFALKDVAYLRSELTDDFDEVNSIASDLASKFVDEYVLMLPQGDIEEAGEK